MVCMHSTAWQDAHRDVHSYRWSSRVTLTLRNTVAMMWTGIALLGDQSETLHLALAHTLETVKVHCMRCRLVGITTCKSNTSWLLESVKNQLSMHKSSKLCLWITPNTCHSGSQHAIALCYRMRLYLISLTADIGSCVALWINVQNMVNMSSTQLSSEYFN